MHRQSIRSPSPLLAGLAGVLCSAPVMAEATWADLPGVLLLALAAGAYLYARTAMWWIFGLTAVAWLYRLFTGERSGRTASSLDDEYVFQPDAALLSRVWSLMPVAHIVLTGLSVLCIVLVLMGQSMGFRYEELREAKGAASKHKPIPSRPEDFPSATDRVSFKSQMKTWRKHSPNGMPWPGQSQDKALYIPGLQVEATGGQASIDMVNASSAPLYVKLCQPGSAKCRALRHVFMDHGSKFTLKELAPGDYEVRYLDLSRETAARSRTIMVPEGRTLPVSLTIFGKTEKGQGDFAEMALAGF